MVRIQIETGYLDVKEGTNFPLNFQVGDIRDLTQRKGTFSKTITLSGTKNNNTLLNNYYDVNIVAGTFDINKLTRCTVLQNGVPIVSNALLQLVNVKKTQITDAYEQEVEYEVLVRDSQAEFYSTITNLELTNLDFTPLGENLVMSVDGASGTLEDLVKKVDNGLLLTTFWYIRMVDPNSLLLTGLTRDGVYHVKGGEVVGATNNFRWNDSPVSALSRIVHAGATEWTQPREWAGDMSNMAIPPLVIKDFNMSTVSPGN